MKLKKFLNLVDLHQVIERETRSHMSLNPTENVQSHFDK